MKISALTAQDYLFNKKFSNPKQNLAQKSSEDFNSQMGYNGVLPLFNNYNISFGGSKIQNFKRSLKKNKNISQDDMLKISNLAATRNGSKIIDTYNSIRTHEKELSGDVCCALYETLAQDDEFGTELVQEVLDDDDYYDMSLGEISLRVKQMRILLIKQKFSNFYGKLSDSLSNFDDIERLVIGDIYKTTTLDNIDNRSELLDKIIQRKVNNGFGRSIASNSCYRSAIYSLKFVNNDNFSLANKLISDTNYMPDNILQIISTTKNKDAIIRKERFYDYICEGYKKKFPMAENCIDYEYSALINSALLQKFYRY